MNFFSAHNRQTNQTKPHWLLALSMSLMLITQAAHADFRKALEAYQKRDGTTMLNEVKDAVYKRNDDGLILFLSCLEVDAILSNRIFFDPYKKSKNDTPHKNKSIFEEILSTSQQDELRLNLRAVVNKSTDLAKYRFIYMPRFNPELRESWLAYQKTVDNHLAIEASFEQLKNFNAKRIELLRNLAQRGYSPAALDLYYILGDENLYPKDSYAPQEAFYWLQKAANANNPKASFLLAGKYLDVDVPYGCSETQKSLVDICKNRNEKLGEYWLSKAAKHAYLSNFPLGDFSYVYGRFLQGKKTIKDKKVAQNWLMLALNSKRQFISESQVTERIEKHSDHSLASNIDENLSKFLHKNIVFEKNVIFDYTVKTETIPLSTIENIGGFNLRLFKDGRANFTLGQIASGKENVEIKWQLSQQKLKQFTNKLEKLDLQSNPIKYPDIVCIDAQSCGLKTEYVVVFDKTIRFLESNGFNLEQLTEQDKKIVHLIDLVEEFFSTQHILCEMNYSTPFIQDCKQHFMKVSNISKQGDK